MMSLLVELLFFIVNKYLNIFLKKHDKYYIVKAIGSKILFDNDVINMFSEVYLFSVTGKMMF